MTQGRTQALESDNITFTHGMCMCVYMHACMYICIYVCMYIYIYTHDTIFLQSRNKDMSQLYTHTYIHIHTYTDDGFSARTNQGRQTSI